MLFFNRRKQVASASPAHNLTQKARLYEFDSRYFVCSVRWISEIGEPTVLPADACAQALGEAVFHHLQEFDPSELDLRDTKKRDWPAFLESGAKSVRSFEANAWHCDLRRVGGSIEVWAHPRLSLKDGVSAYCSANAADPEVIGEAIRNALAGAKAMRKLGVV